MAFIPDTGDLALRYAPYIHELNEFFTSHDLRYGAPDDLTLLAHRLATSKIFAGELASMLRSFIFRERGAIPHASLLAILALSSGGTHIESYAYDLQHPLEDLSTFVSTVVGTPVDQLPPVRSLTPEQVDSEPVPLVGVPAPPAPLASVNPQPRASLPYAEPASFPDPFPTGVQADKFLAAAMLTAADLQRNRPVQLPESQPSNNRRLWVVGTIALPVIALAAFILNRTPAPADTGAYPPATVSTATPAPTFHPPTSPPAPSSLTAPLPLISPSSQGISALPSSTLPPSNGSTSIRPGTPQSSVSSPQPRTSGANSPQPIAPSTASSIPSPAPTPVPPTVAEMAPSSTTPAPSPSAPAPVAAPASTPPRTTTSVASVTAHQGASGISSGIMSSHLLRSSHPPYPKMASLIHAEGTVILQAVVSKTGKVISVHAVDGPRTLRKAAVNSVRTWRYRPYIAEGRAVDVATIISIDFKAPH